MKIYDHFQCSPQTSGRLNNPLNLTHLTQWPLEVSGNSGESYRRGNLYFTAERVKRGIDAHVQLGILAFSDHARV
jgi:hypothetical protein